MNKLKGFISNVSTSGNISIVEVNIQSEKIFSIIIGNKEEFLKIGNEVYVIFKETEVSIAKDFKGEISLQNRLNCKILKIKKGKLLTEIIMQWKNEKIKSIITTKSAERLSLREGDNITAFIKTNEVSLMEI